MQASKDDLMVTVKADFGEVRQAEWDGMTVEMGSFDASVDPAPLFKGLPDDRCQTPHWGYVLKGQLRFRFADHEEVYNAGEAYYAEPGHTPSFEAGTEYVEFSPTDQLEKTMEVLERNMAAG